MKAQSTLLEGLGYDAVAVADFKSKSDALNQEIADMAGFSATLRGEVMASKEAVETQLAKFVELNARVQVMFDDKAIGAVFDEDVGGLDVTMPDRHFMQSRRAAEQ